MTVTASTSQVEAAHAVPSAILTTPRERVGEFDVMRGIAIVMVVYLHAYFSAWDVTPSRQVLAMHVIHLVAHTAVPAFLFISAFLLARDDTPTVTEFVRRKVSRILIPLFCWMLAAAVYRSAYLHQDIGSIRKDLLLFNISGQYFYLFVLVIFYTSFYFLRSWDSRRRAYLAAFAFLASLATVALYESSTMAGDFATIAYRNPLVWFFAYSFGFWAGSRERGIEWPHRAQLTAGLGMLAAGAVYLFMGQERGYYPVSYFGVTVFLFAACSFVVYPAAIHWAITRSPWSVCRLVTRPFAWLSRYAFAIYLVHMPFFIGYVTERFVAPSSIDDDWWALMNTEFIVGFAASLAFVWSANKLSPRFGRELLGVG